MIIYEKRQWGLPLLTRMYGSALPRCLPFAVLSGALTLVLELTIGDNANDESPSKDEDTPWWWHPYPFQIFAFIVGFMLVFRSNFGYSRYWEARTNLQLMSTRWTDALTHCVAFDSCTLPNDLTEELRAKSETFQRNITHLISLLHAVALQTLRLDYELGNIKPHTLKSERPPMDAYDVKGHYHNNVGVFTWKNSFQLNSSEAVRSQYYKHLPLYVIRGLSDAELLSLRPRTNDEKGGGVGTPTPEKTDRAQTVLMWVHRLILKRRREGGLSVEPPIMSRVHHLLSEGMHGFDQCRKTAETPFPFPWAQLTVMCLFAFSLTAPVVITSFVTQPFFAVVLDVITVVTSYALNEVARDLEDPFLYDPNDLPLATYQFDFNKKLTSILETRVPDFPPHEELNGEYLDQDHVTEDVQLDVDGAVTVNTNGVSNRP